MNRSRAQYDSPWKKFVAELRARTDDELCQRAAREIESLRETILDMQRDHREELKDAHAEGKWVERLGDDYGSY